MTSIKVGDVVALKSGGPKMTVESVSSAGLLSCVYIAEDGKLHRENLRSELFAEPKKPRAAENTDKVYPSAPVK